VVRKADPKRAVEVLAYLRKTGWDEGKIQRAFAQVGLAVG
jgi:hypothetical protein